MRSGSQALCLKNGACQPGFPSGVDMSPGVGALHFQNNNWGSQQADWVFSFSLSFSAATLGSLAQISGHLHILLSPHTPAAHHAHVSWAFLTLAFKHGGSGPVSNCRNPHLGQSFQEERGMRSCPRSFMNLLSAPDSSSHPMWPPSTLLASTKAVQLTNSSTLFKTGYQMSPPPWSPPQHPKASILLLYFAKALPPSRKMWLNKLWYSNLIKHYVYFFSFLWSETKWVDMEMSPE